MAEQELDRISLRLMQKTYFAVPKEQLTLPSVSLTGEEIRARLSVLASQWSVYEGGERAEAQASLNELFECYGMRRGEVARFEEPQAGRFLDLIWPRVCLIEMKAPAEARRLSKHREQALGYWVESADAEAGVPAPRFVVICAFRRLEIWEPGAYPRQPRLVLDLVRPAGSVRRVALCRRSRARARLRRRSGPAHA